MTLAESIPRNGTERPVSPAPEPAGVMTDAQKRDAARAAWRGDPSITGVELGRRYDMTEGWGRKQIRAARHANGSPPVTPEAAEYGPPAPAAEPRRKVNGTARTPAPTATPRPAKPARKPVQPEPLPAAPRALVVVTKVAVAVVAAVATVVSYSHTRDLAVAADQTGTLLGIPLASILPAAVDGLVVVGSTSLLVDRHNRRTGSTLAWAAVVIGLLSSMAANVVAVDLSAGESPLVDMRAVRVVMAAYAPVALAISGHLLLRMLDQPKAEAPR